MKKLFSIIAYLFSRKHFTGVSIDTRSQIEKQKDYMHEESHLASVSVPSYDNQKIVSSPYIIENQNQTSSCVAHGVTLAAGIYFNDVVGVFRRFSKMFVYRQRSNYPDGGMWLQEAFEIIRKNGSCLYNTLPNPTTEAQANSIIITQTQRDEAIANKVPEYFTIQNPNDIDTLCAVAQQGIPVSIIIYSSYREWSSIIVTILDSVGFRTAPVRHCICVLPKSGFRENGKRYLTIQDSAWFGGYYLRHVDEDFIKSRVYGAAYWKPYIAPPVMAKPSYSFKYPLSYGSKGADVVALQNILIYEQLIPADLNTGNYLGRTQAGVKALQEKYASEILIPLGMTSGTGVVGLATLKWLNKHYGVVV